MTRFFFICYINSYVVVENMLTAIIIKFNIVELYIYETLLRFDFIYFAELIGFCGDVLKTYPTALEHHFYYFYAKGPNRKKFWRRLFASEFFSISRFLLHHLVFSCFHFQYFKLESILVSNFCFFLLSHPTFTFLLLEPNDFC